ncbi:endolytic transglycosylase MltG [Microbacterium capsulatum]|uniref:Endolytic murein transglycosylase n=1 Tax=Microbacterium capsulatum TaxID=3041921 RepID=A0ABU0XDG2_9MICO|nr:endolytic transglycosylase MltG [Microbacterium sp. ASV81]MDQ4212764.1 endolytic transglycosylase MltG [Microbacterium sp. ASV81]
MSDREESAGGEKPDLFGALPDPQVQVPRPAESPAVPGSRRAAREAAEAQQAAGAPRTTPIPQPTTSPQPAGPAPAVVPASPAGSATPTDPAPAVGAAAAALTEPAPEPAPAHPHHDVHSTLEALFHHSPDASAPAKPRRKRRRGCFTALVIVFVLLGGAAGGGLWVWNTYGAKISETMGWGPSKDYEAGQATGQALVTINKGDGGQQVSTALYKAGVTKTQDVFYNMLVKNGTVNTFYPGVYHLQNKMTAAAALKALNDPKNKMQNSALIPEGYTVDATIQRISQSVDVPLADLQAAVKNPADYGVNAPSLEGWLFPALYEFGPGATAKDIVGTLVKRTRDSLAAANVPAADQQRVLTIASIVQREARQEADFYKVSRVIANRLAQGMKLQMDSTAQYGYHELNAGTASTSEAAQHNDNPWNTYVIDGLPKTPIANPGDKAIDAAMHPVAGSWLYFVTVNMDTGETIFSTTYADQQKAVSQMQDWCKAHPDSGC